jgi:hypothetical protein
MGDFILKRKMENGKLKIENEEKGELRVES